MLNNLINNERFIPFSMSPKGPCINHLAYVDDLLIFSSGKSSSIKLIMKQVRRYERSSGQKVNMNKSYFLTAPNTGASRINKMREATGFMDKNFPFTYLGCPIYVGRKKIFYFEDLLSKIVKRLNGWQGRMLSYGGRLILIKHVLQSLPTYTLVALNPPKGILNLMEKHWQVVFGLQLVINQNIIGVLGRIYVFLKKKVGRHKENARD